MTAQQRIAGLEKMWQASEDNLIAAGARIDALERELAAERIENAHLREAFRFMERGYNLAAAVLEGAEVFSERQPLVCTEDGIIEDPSKLAIVVGRAAWEAWKARGKE